MFTTTKSGFKWVCEKPSRRGTAPVCSPFCRRCSDRYLRAIEPLLDQERQIEELREFQRLVGPSSPFRLVQQKH